VASSKQQFIKLLSQQTLHAGYEPMNRDKTSDSVTGLDLDALANALATHPIRAC